MALGKKIMIHLEGIPSILRARLDMWCDVLLEGGITDMTNAFACSQIKISFFEPRGSHALSFAQDEVERYESRLPCNLCSWLIETNFVPS